MHTPTLTFVQMLWAWGIASAFVLWPVAGKYSQATGSWVNTVVLVISALVGIAFAIPSLSVQSVPSARAIVILACAGAVNGAAVYFYSLKTVDPMVPTGAFIMTVIVLMVLMTPVFSYLLHGDALSPRQWMGLGAALIAIYLLAG